MNIFSTQERRFAKNLKDLLYCNPFLPERVNYEIKTCGDKTTTNEPSWHLGMDSLASQDRLNRLIERCTALIHKTHKKLKTCDRIDASLWMDYEDLVMFHLYHSIQKQLETCLLLPPEQRAEPLEQCYDAFCERFESTLNLPCSHPHLSLTPDHLFACFYQARRAFHYTFTFLTGRSKAMAKLRASIWQTLFTRDLKRYREHLVDLMPTMSTLITGASGTGKEVVARAIGHSGYIPFNAKNKRFTMEPEEQFRALNLSAMPLNLIESELFGHSKGAFTGATTNKKGWLESCPKGGTLFIDEIGELDESLQIKLLRVLQTRQFQKVGETQSRHFEGRFIAATNRNLSLAMSQGDFRTDFYYRLCSDRIETPSLTHILKEDPEEISHLLQQLCLRLLPHGGAEELIHEAMSVIKTDLPKTYPWPGNFRELEQCVNQVLIRGQYTPEAFHHSIEQHPQPDDWLRKVREGQLNLEALLSHYCQHVYNACGSYEEAARQLNVDRRTIKRYVVLPKAMNDDTSK